MSDFQDNELIQHLEDLGDLHRAVMRQQHPAGADTDAASLGRHPGYHDLRGGARERRRGMVFGEPVTVVAEPVRQTRQIQGVAQGSGRGGSLRYDGLVEDGQFHAGLLHGQGRKEGVTRPKGW